MTLPTLFDDRRSVASVPLAVAERVARTPCSILLTGETGTGKGYLAHWLHDHGSRTGPLVPVNCGALPEEIVDSHLFGHVRGAFSDAKADHDGLVRAAEGGTLLLDEVGELPPHVQLRLLRLLEEREVQPVGASRPIKVDVRVIAATSRNLEEMVASGAFRNDLYYRLNLIRFQLRPLRERVGEIVDLVETLDAELVARDGGSPLEFAHDAWAILHGHSWSGNVRELRSVLERLRLFANGGPVTADCLMTAGRLQRVEASGDLRARTARAALESVGGCVTRAADKLGVHRSTVHRWLARAS